MTNDFGTAINKPLQISINTYGWFDDILNEKGKADEAFAYIRECGFEGIDYNKVPWKRKNCTDWDGFIAGLRSIEYKGAINFETHCALTDTPKELVPDVLRFIAGIGRYFKGRIEE